MNKIPQKNESPNPLPIDEHNHAIGHESKDTGHPHNACQKSKIYSPFLNFRNLQPESIFVKGCFKILNKKIQIQSKSELTDILCICNTYSTGKSERRF